MPHNMEIVSWPYCDVTLPDVIGGGTGGGGKGAHASISDHNGTQCNVGGLPVPLHF